MIYYLLFLPYLSSCSKHNFLVSVHDRSCKKIFPKYLKYGIKYCLLFNAVTEVSKRLYECFPANLRTCHFCIWWLRYLNMHCMLKASLYFIWPFGVIASLQLVTVIQIFFVKSTKFFSFSSRDQNVHSQLSNSSLYKFH